MIKLVFLWVRKARTSYSAILLMPLSRPDSLNERNNEILNKVIFSMSIMQSKLTRYDFKKEQ